jgi:uncharacterized protein (TIGR04255 family)
MRRQYRKPPILEATFECHFESSESWSLASPASVFEYLKSDYPAEPTTVSAGNLEINTQEGTLSPSFRVLPQAQRYQFKSLDGLHLVRVGREALSVHELAPYPGWEVFRTRIIQALTAYIQTTKPTGVVRISIRYVNQINLGAGPIELTHYFNIPFETPEGLDFTVSSFFLRFEAVRPDGIKLIQSFASLPGETVSVILDLDLIRELPDVPAELVPGVTREVDSLRELEREAFESVITDKLRETFDADVTP